ncbi:Non-specific serine/threonine protein kinase protein [Dioscorea alata]|uniref:Non-specific serine/threonine protein kinase protein n=1 Tax=Dioscorea alata TaxID=55571 RepID=A0ACB7W8C8_DIOAL|nr:Non-specific serine/threonine protein kinase protein [Dioscorea alata]
MGREWGIWFFLACIWLSNQSFINGDTNATDAAALNALYSSLNLPPQLTGWTQSGGDPCGQSWKGITCSGSSVTQINLSGLGLNGSMGYMISNLASLIELDLSNNNLGNGSQIPYNLPSTLHRLNLAGNQYTGNIPYSIALMLSLEHLDLAHNQLQGSLADVFQQLTNLSMMDLSFNNFSAELPQSFSSLSSLKSLYLQSNKFSGQIDVLADLPLQDLNVANNNFSGSIPDQLLKINNLQIGGNQFNVTLTPPPPSNKTPPGRRANPSQSSGGDSGSSSDSGGEKSSGIGIGGIVGIIVSVLVISFILVFLLIRRKKSEASSKGNRNPEQDQLFTPLPSYEVKEMKQIQTSSLVSTNVVQPTTPITLKPPPRQKSFDSDEFSTKAIVKNTSPISIKATVYSVADLQIATESFSIDNLIGEGSSGRVYKAQFIDGKVLAVKKINSSALPNQSSEDFLEVVSNVSRLHHPNLTELVGYCSEHGQHLMVYEFHKNGSLHDFLHISDEYKKPLSWNARVKIALGSARALEYLHEVCSPSVVHKNFRSANILLDAELNPHLSDCGLAALIPDPEYQSVENSTSSGYNAPEVAMSGQYTLKSDVYSFGVVMLELITGRKPFDSSRPRSEQSLVRWATPQLHDIDALDKMVDPALKGLCPPKSLSRFADVIALCVQPEPEFRPPMSEVVQALLRLVQRANMSKRLSAGDDDQDLQEFTF